MTASNPGDIMFGWKLVGIVFTTCRIGISGLILNLRAMGLTYFTVAKVGLRCLIAKSYTYSFISFLIKLELFDREHRSRGPRNYFGDSGLSNFAKVKKDKIGLK